MKKMRLVRLAFCLFGSVAATAVHAAPAELASLVNPFVGTDREGDVFPGVVAPFGMIQLTPNRSGNGYYWKDTRMHGFALNLMSGNGGDDEGQGLFTATTGPVVIDVPPEPTGKNRGLGRQPRSTDYTFDHSHESASAGYYQVLMQPWNINAELTTTTRCGLARFTFPAGKQANIVLPTSYANTPTLAAHVRFTDKRTAVGTVTTRAFFGPRKGITIYFKMVFSRPFDTVGVATDGKLADGTMQADEPAGARSIAAFGSYKSVDQSTQVEARIGLSYVDEAGAAANLAAEMPDFGFDKYRQQAAAAWNQQLHVIDVDGGTDTHNKIFYTALYHALIAPSTYNDVDGRYMGYDAKVHTVTKGHDVAYSTFSGWDIYRSEIPLLAIIAPERTMDMAQSIVDSYQQLGFIDRWLQVNQPTGVMAGNPLTICLAHIWNAGLRDWDIDTAYQGMIDQTREGNVHSKLHQYQDLTEEREHGVTLNVDASPSSVLEYDVSFAALGHLAASLGKKDDARYLLGRSLQYRLLFNPANGFLQHMTADGRWDKPGDYCEGNEWIYNWFVPHDVAGLMQLMGGPDAFDKRLDKFFGEKRYDPTNEPDLQSPFYYNYIDKPWKTQKLVAETADEMFKNEPGGLAGGGNDDLGTMSAWYILTQLGFYPVDPGIADFNVCTPRFTKATLHLAPPHHGTDFVIDAPEASPGNVYIRSAALNGKPLDKPWFKESEILQGGSSHFDLAAQPNEKWGSKSVDRPFSISTGYGRESH